MSEDRPSITTIRKGCDRQPVAWGADNWKTDISEQSATYVESTAVHGHRIAEGPTNGLQSWWKLTESNSPSTLTDSVGGHHATLHGGNFVNTSRGTAVYFDGNDHASVELPFTQSFTTSIWAKSGPSSGWSGSGVLLSARDANGFIIHPRDGSREWGGYVLDTTDNSHHQIADDHPISNIDVWHQYAITYDHESGVAISYFDGAKQGATTLQIPREEATITTYFGRDTGGHQDRYYVGYLSEARYYSRALSSTEIESLYTATNK
ncbi:LamG domain-containing protein [Halohasta litorea]|uniref:LamG domain-containing protein n=1 Tax=Halohasta litorea TaxID=869891 RepID=A0ABD6DBT0_9EURY|nr:LamG domain-containing protein [Halohasta litorea]